MSLPLPFTCLTAQSHSEKCLVCTVVVMFWGVMLSRLAHLLSPALQKAGAEGLGMRVLRVHRKWYWGALEHEMLRS